MATIKYVAYTDLGPDLPSGATVNPAAFGGEESDDFKYLLDHGNVLPVSHPSAAIAMGSSPEIEDNSAAHQAEVDALKARIAELEASKTEKAEAKTESTAGTTGGSGAKVTTGGGGGGGSSTSGGSGSSGKAS